MKKLKNIFNYSVALFIMFIGITNIQAYNEKTGAIKKGDLINFDGGKVVTSYHSEYPNFYYKYSDESGGFLCASGFSLPPSFDKSCTYSAKLSNETYKGLGIAYIINSIAGTDGGKKSPSAEEYYWMEMSELYYSGKYTSSDTTYNLFAKAVINNSNFKIPKVNVNLKTLLSDANAYQEKYSKKLDITVSESSLKFTKADDGYFYSQKVYVTDVNNNADKVSISVNNNNFEKIEGTDETGKFIQLKIEKSKVIGKKLDVTITFNASNTYYSAIIYYCGTAYQNMANTLTEKRQSSDTATVSGSVSMTSLNIAKEDNEGKPLAGAKIKVECAENNYSQVFETTGKTIVIEDLPYCEYKITEIESPDKYVKDDKEYTASIQESNLSESITLTNKLNRIEISKKNIATGDLLPGAILQVRDENDNVLYQWESSNEAYVIEGLSMGTYYLVEISAPAGYDLNVEKVKFVVDDTLEVLKVEMVNVLHVDVPDTLSSSSAQLMCLSMFDIALGIGILVFVKSRKNKNA